MPILAALPAVAALGSLASGAVGTGMAIDNASKQGSNPGTAPIDQSVGQMDPNAFGYGGGIQSPEQQALRGEHQAAQAANDQATERLTRIQQAIAAGQEASKKHPAFRSDAEKAAVAGMIQAARDLGPATQEAQKA